MAGGSAIKATADTGLIEAPVTTKAYLMCAFAAFGGIFFGFDSGYINGVLDTNYAIHTYTHLPYPPTGNSPEAVAAQTVRTAQCPVETWFISLT